MSTWDADATQGTVDRAACDAVVDIEVSLFMASPEKRKFKADDVVAGAATFRRHHGTPTSDTAAARAVFRDAIARVAGVDKDQVRIVSVSPAARRRLTESVTVEFEVHHRKREAASVSAIWPPRRTRRSWRRPPGGRRPTATTSDGGHLFTRRQVREPEPSESPQRSAPKKKKKRGEDLALYAILSMAAA